VHLVACGWFRWGAPSPSQSCDFLCTHHQLALSPFLPPLSILTNTRYVFTPPRIIDAQMFARNLATDPSYVDLLNSVNFFIVPIFNVQGYLRQSENGRINQHGPNTSGRRGNAKNMNLNRDFSKLANPETRAVVSVFNDYDVAFYADLHSTDGMNYQDDVTWCDNGDSGLSPSIYGWLRSEMKPALTEFLEGYNHFPGDCYYANDNMDPTAGSYPYFSDGTEYSTNYADHRQIPAYLLEMHSLKPYRQRVLGAYAFIYGVTSVVANKTESLMAAIEEDRSARIGTCHSLFSFWPPSLVVDYFWGSAHVFLAFLDGSRGRC
jgi:Zinc carboxypeptidase